MEDTEYITGLLTAINGMSTRQLETINKGEEITSADADSIREAAQQLYQTIIIQQERTELLKLAHAMLGKKTENIDDVLRAVIEHSRKGGASDGFWRGCQH